MHAIEAFLRDTRAACNQFTEVSVDIDLPKAGHSKLSEIKSALKAAQRAFRDAKIRAYQTLLNVVAAEYLIIDSDPEAYSTRLTQDLVPYVCERLPILRDDRLIYATILASVTTWETQRRVGKAAKGLYAATSVCDTPGNVIDRFRHQKGWTIEELAGHADVDIKQIYKVKNGETVTTTTIGKIAFALECHPGALIPTSTVKSHY